MEMCNLEAEAVSSVVLCSLFVVVVMWGSLVVEVVEVLVLGHCCSCFYNVVIAVLGHHGEPPQPSQYLGSKVGLC